MEEKYLKIFTEFGPSGQEERIGNYLETLMKPYVDESYTDVMGNLICVKKGKGSSPKKIMLAAHMDQIGFIVTHIDKRGYLRFHTLGGHSPYFQLFQRVVFANGTRGVIDCEKEAWMFPKLKMSELYVDVLASSKEDAQKHVSIGDKLVWETKPFVQNGKLCSVALDDRIGCYALLKTAELLNGSPHTIYFVFTVQEEVGCRGAKTSAYKIEPDLGIAVDITGSDDGPAIERGRFANVLLGKGVAIKVMDNGIIVPKRLVDWEVSLALEIGIPYQREILTGGATDAFAIHLTKSGILASTLSIPTRHGHTSGEVCSLSDVENTVNLLKAMCECEELPE